MVLGGGTLGGEATGEGGAQARMRARGRLLACCAHSTVAVRVEARLAAGDMGRASEGSAPQVLGFCEVVQRGGVSACAGRAWLECRLRGRLRPDALGAPPPNPGDKAKVPTMLRGEFGRGEFGRMCCLGVHWLECRLQGPTETGCPGCPPPNPWPKSKGWCSARRGELGTTGDARDGMPWAHPLLTLSQARRASPAVPAKV